MTQKNVCIIGAGVAGLSAASYLAKEGHNVTILEKNSTIGGRAREYHREGYKFDMGPSFYWMPDIFQTYFNDFNKEASNYYPLKRLDPSYRVYFGDNDFLDLSSDIDKVYQTFENMEKGSSKFLKKFLKQGQYNYRVAIDKVMEKPGKSPFELIMPETVLNFRQFLTSLNTQVNNNIKSPKLRAILEFPVLFLGAKPSKTPYFYCFMNYADMMLGTWHPMGGFYKFIEGMNSITNEYNVTIKTNCNVIKIDSISTKCENVAKSVEFIENGIKNILEFDYIISTADYNFSEKLINPKLRNYSDRYWESKVLAPSALLFYVAFNRKISNIEHHTLFFDSNFTDHAQDIYDNPKWPLKPLFYSSFPSKTDPSFAPEGCDSAVFLIPIAPGLKDTDELKEAYFLQIVQRFKKCTGEDLTDSILFKESYCVSNFIKDYNSYKGNAYGLANVLTQTGFLKPKIENRNISNMAYAGQLTVPGPGVPPSIISGKIAAKLILDKISNGQ